MCRERVKAFSAISFFTPVCSCCFFHLSISHALMGVDVFFWWTTSCPKKWYVFSIQAERQILSCVPKVCFKRLVQAGVNTIVTEETRVWEFVGSRWSLGLLNWKHLKGWDGSGWFQEIGSNSSIFIYIYIYMCKYLCICICIFIYIYM